MDYDNIKIQLDNGPIYRYEELVDEDDDPEANYDIRITKHVSNGVVMPGETDNHVIRIWLASDAPLDARGQEFNGKVKVFAGQVNEKQQTKYADASCFTITDDGTLTDYDIDTCGTDLVIPASINGITIKKINNLFLGNKAELLTNLDISNLYDLEEVGQRAFSNGGGYTGNQNVLVIPESVNIIGKSGFETFNGLSLTLPKKMQSIGDDAFLLYRGYDQDLIIPNGIETIGNRTFYSFNGNNIVFPNSVKHIEKSGFDHYNGTNLNLPSSLETIGEYAFQHYHGSNSVLTIPDNVTSIGNAAFVSYEGPKIILSNSLTEIGDSAFWQYNGSSITIPSTITSIGQGAFMFLGSTKKIIMDMTPAQYTNVIKGSSWNGFAQIVCMVNKTEVPCE